MSKRENSLFSEAEQKVLKFLKFGRAMSITQLTEFYHDGKPPQGANNNVAQIVRRINLKCEHHKLPWFINGWGFGRGGRTVMRDRK